MRRIFVVMVTAVFIAGLTPAFAAGMHSGVHGIRGARVEPPQRVPNMQNRIPAPLPEPTQPPVINGPLSPNGMLPPMGNGL